MGTEDVDLGGTVVSETVRAYDIDAAAYAAATRDYRPFPGMRDVILEILRILPPAASILDAGCGGGRDSLFLGDYSHSVVALDRSGPLLRTWQAGIGCRSIHLVQGDLRSLPLKDETFHLILAAASLLHFPHGHLRIALQELARVLTRSGRIFVTMRARGKTGWTTHGAITNRRWENFVSPAEMVALLEGAGLSEAAWSLNGEGLWYLATARKS